MSLSDPDARPIRTGKLGKPNEFGYVTQLAELTENTGQRSPEKLRRREPSRRGVRDGHRDERRGARARPGRRALRSNARAAVAAFAA